MENKCGYLNNDPFFDWQPVKCFKECLTCSNNVRETTNKLIDAILWVCVGELLRERPLFSCRKKEKEHRRGKNWKSFLLSLLLLSLLLFKEHAVFQRLAVLICNLPVAEADSCQRCCRDNATSECRPYDNNHPLPNSRPCVVGYCLNVSCSLLSCVCDLTVVVSSSLCITASGISFSLSLYFSLTCSCLYVYK